MLDDDALQRRRAAAIVGVGFQNDRLVGRPGPDDVGAGAGGVGLQPAVAHVAVDLVLHGDLAVDDGADDRADQRVDKGRREVDADGDDERRVIGRGDHGVDVVLGPAQLAEEEDRGLFELDDALQRPGRVPGGYRVAGGEGLSGADREGESLAIVADCDALGDAGNEAVHVGGLEPHDTVIDVGNNLDARELVGLGRVKRDKIVDLLGDNQRIGGGGSLRPKRQRNERGRQQGVSKGFEHEILPEDITAVLRPSGPAAACSM